MGGAEKGSCSLDRGLREAGLRPRLLSVAEQEQSGGPPFDSQSQEQWIVRAFRFHHPRGVFNRVKIPDYGGM